MKKLTVNECNQLIYQVGLCTASAIQLFTSHMPTAHKAKIIAQPNQDNLSGSVVQPFITIAEFLKARMGHDVTTLKSSEMAVTQARIQLESLQQKPLNRDWKKQFDAALNAFDTAMIFARSDDPHMTMDAAKTELEKRGRAKQ